MSAGLAVTRLALGQVRRGTTVVALLAGGLSAMVAVQYRQTFSGSMSSSTLEALAANPAIRTLFGTPVALDDAGGFTVWRTGTAVACLVGVWALLTATRVSRGEEESGRWGLLLAGQLRLRTVVGRHLAVLLGAQVLVGAALAAGLTAAGTRLPGAVLHAVGIALVGAFFTTLGMVAAQLTGERRTASGATAAALGLLLMIRMVADGVEALHWLAWFTPFGLLARAEPYAADRVLPLVVLAAATGALAVASWVAAGRRDVGSGLLATHAPRRSGTGLLGSLPAIAAWRARPGTVAWGVGIGAYYLLIGLMAVSMTDFLSQNPRFAELAAKAGFAELGSVEGYTATLFALLAVPLGAYAAARVAADAADEAAGRLTLVFAAPLSRVRWAAAQTGATLLGCALLTVTAAVATWIGTRAVGAPLGPGAALAGALNLLPVAVLSLGAALLALGWAPRAVLALGALPAAGGFLLTVLADSLGWPRWTAQISPYAHVAAVPSEPVDAAGAVGLLALAAVIGAVGIAGYARRDLRG